MTFRKFKYSSYGVFINHVHAFQFLSFSLLTYKREIFLVQGESILVGKLPWGKCPRGKCPGGMYTLRFLISIVIPNCTCSCIPCSMLECSIGKCNYFQNAYHRSMVIFSFRLN